MRKAYIILVRSLLGLSFRCFVRHCQLYEAKKHYCGMIHTATIMAAVIADCFYSNCLYALMYVCLILLERLSRNKILLPDKFPGTKFCFQKCSDNFLYLRPLTWCQIIFVEVPDGELYLHKEFCYRRVL